MSLRQDYTFRRGQSIKIVVTVERLTNDLLPYNEISNPYIPVDLTDSTAAMQWRVNADKSVVLTASTGVDGLIVIDQPTTGVINVIIPPAITEALNFRGESIDYGYDLEITDTAGTKTYPLYGTITLDKDYTRV